MSKQKRAMRWARPDERVGKLQNYNPKPGNKVFIGNRGEVRFDIPEEWVINIGDDSIRFNDKEPPDDNAILQLSVHYLPPGIDFSGLPIRSMIESLNAEDRDTEEHKALSRGPVTEIRRGALEIAWCESRVFHFKENREAISRLALARCNGIQPLITMDFWPEDHKQFDPIWTEVLRSLHVGESIPAKEPQISPLAKEGSLLSPYSSTAGMLKLDPMTKKGASLPPKQATRISDKISPNRLAPVSKSNQDFDGVTMSLPENHGWKSSPGYLIFVANKGEVRFDYPETWITEHTSPITFRDAEPPLDTCRMRLFIYHPTKKHDPSTPISDVLMDLFDIVKYENPDDDPGYSMGRGDIVVEPREDLDLAWRQSRFFNPNLGREMTTRSAAGRAGGSIAFLLLDFPTEEREKYEAIWTEILRSLQVGLTIEDPTKYFMH
jgi:hypothetical protein